MALSLELSTERPCYAPRGDESTVASAWSSSPLGDPAAEAGYADESYRVIEDVVIVRWLGTAGPSTSPTWPSRAASDEERPPRARRPWWPIRGKQRCRYLFRPNRRTRRHRRRRRYLRCRRPRRSRPRCRRPRGAPYAAVAAVLLPAPPLAPRPPLPPPPSPLVPPLMSPLLPRTRTRRAERGCLPSRRTLQEDPGWFTWPPSIDGVA